MSSNQQKTAAPHAGIRLSRLNIGFIAVGLIIALFMVIFMYQTYNSFQQIVSVTDAYLSAQQTAGMLRNISEGMSEQCAAFIRSGTPDAAHGYAGQLKAINAQLESDAAFKKEGDADDEFMVLALETFQAMTETEIRAMRLMAETLPMGLESLPLILQQAELSTEDQALPPEEKKAAALSLISSDEYLALSKTLETAVDDSHRVASEQGKNRAVQTARNVTGIMDRQMIMIILFVLVAILALLINYILIIHPIRKSVDNLDRREPIPVQGAFEMRHLARVYNDVLEDNQKKAEALSFTATHDALTGVYNRAAFDNAYRENMDKQIGIMVADVDHFKQYNDDFGHDIGDRVLQIVVEKFKEHFRAEDIISRIGGDEFCIIMPNTVHAQSGVMAEKIVRINRELADIQEGLPPITVSAGFAFWNRPDPKGSIFKDADSMLLELKKNRGACCAVYPGILS